MTSRPLDARLLHTFATVAREGNVSRAAQKLFLSQPAVSLQLKELQGVLQVELLHKGGLAGGRPAAHADDVLKNVLEYVDQFSTRIRSANN